MIWEFMEALADPEDFAVKIEKDGSISLRSIYDLKEDGYRPKGASRYAKLEPKMLSIFEGTYEDYRNTGQAISKDDELTRGEV